MNPGKTLFSISQAFLSFTYFIIFKLHTHTSTKRLHILQSVYHYLESLLIILSLKPGYNIFIFPSLYDSSLSRTQELAHMSGKFVPSCGYTSTNKVQIRCISVHLFYLQTCKDTSFRNGAL